jgi:excisionase family DNA binding protein
MGRLMTVKEAADYLGINVSYIYKAMRDRPGQPSHLRHIRIWRRLYTTQEWIEQWIGRVASEPESQVR